MTNQNQNTGGQTGSGKGKKGGQKKDNIIFNLVKTDKKDKTFELGFEVILRRPSGAKIVDAKFEIRYQGKGLCSGITDAQGYCSFELSFDRKVGMESVELTLLVLENSNATMTKKFPLPKKREIKKVDILSISNGKKDWSFEDLRVHLHIETTSKKFKSGDYQIKVMDSNHNIFKTLTSNSGGTHEYKLTIPLSEIQDILEFQDGVKKLKFMITSKEGSEDKPKISKFEMEHEVPITLPSGSVKDSCIAFAIRKRKHFADFSKATLGVMFISWFVNNSGQGAFDYLAALFSIIIASYLCFKTKSKFKAVVFGIWAISAVLIAFTGPTLITETLAKSLVLAYMIGVPTYVAEEIFRKKDGSSYINFYPWVPIGILGVVIIWHLVSFLAGLFILFNYELISSSLYNATLCFFVLIILLLFGGSGEAIDWIKAWGSGSASALTTAQSTGILSVITELLKKFLALFIAKKGR